MRSSIVIAAHNEGPSLSKTVQACIESMKDQDYEIVIADDASCDRSVNEAERRFANVRTVLHRNRRGAAPTKAMGGRHADGDILVFLDAHTNPEEGAIDRLVQDVEQTQGTAIITPALPMLDVHRWTNDMRSVGNGYAFDLLTLDCYWLPLDDMKRVSTGRLTLFESPALIGCALAVSRHLYTKLQGFDNHMRYWGVEDLDLGLKAWSLGHTILHDPEAVVGHRFRTSFDNYEVPIANVLSNQVRMTFKNFTPTVWAHWLEHCRVRNSGPLDGHPEGLWAYAWQLFRADMPSAVEERRHIQAHRTRDEFDYARRYGFAWPRLAESAVPGRSFVLGSSPSPHPSPHPSPSPPPCTVSLALKNTGTVVPKPENARHDEMVAAAGGVDSLGPLPMGQGRADFPNVAYTSPLMVIGTVTAAERTFTFRWKRFIQRRSWNIRKNPAGTAWVVTQRSKRGYPAPADDTGAAVFNVPTPSPALKLYIYDNSALVPGNNALDKAGDFIREEKDFTYRVDRLVDGTWITCASFHVGQIIRVKRVNTTGTTASDWQGQENSTAVQTVSTVITTAKARSMVGGTLPIQIDPAANS